MNNGAWTYVGTRILTAANETQHHKGKYPYYAGRDPTSSVATGSKVCRKFCSKSLLTDLSLPGTSFKTDQGLPRESLRLKAVLFVITASARSHVVLMNTTMTFDF